MGILALSPAVDCVGVEAEARYLWLAVRDLGTHHIEKGKEVWRLGGRSKTTGTYRILKQVLEQAPYPPDNMGLAIVSELAASAMEVTFKVFIRDPHEYVPSQLRDLVGARR